MGFGVINFSLSWVRWIDSKFMVNQFYNKDKFFKSRGEEAREILLNQISTKKTCLRGDFDVCELIEKSNQDNLVQAAVLIPIIERANGFTIILTKRKHNLSNHAGQISFPGGKKDKSDPSFEFTAIREAKEEIGLNINEKEVIGKLQTWETRTGFIITPVVCFKNEIPKLERNADEVEEIFEVPLEYLFNPKNHKLAQRVFKQKEHKFYAIKYLNYYIWGATAGIIINLYSLLG